MPPPITTTRACAGTASLIRASPSPAAESVATRGVYERAADMSKAWDSRGTGEEAQVRQQLDETPCVEMAVLEERPTHFRPIRRRDPVSMEEQARQLEACRLPTGDGQAVVARR